MKTCASKSNPSKLFTPKQCVTSLLCTPQDTLVIEEKTAPNSDALGNKKSFNEDRKKSLYPLSYEINSIEKSVYFHHGSKDT